MNAAPRRRLDVFAHPRDAGPAWRRFDTWADLFEAAARLIGDRRVILIMDEFSYAAESDPALPSNLQAAWDHHFKKMNVTLVLAGSHLGSTPLAVCGRGVHSSGAPGALQP